jgi:hypothetical protein
MLECLYGYLNFNCSNFSGLKLILKTTENFKKHSLSSQCPKQLEKCLFFPSSILGIPVFFWQNIQSKVALKPTKAGQALPETFLNPFL